MDKQAPEVQVINFLIVQRFDWLTEIAYISISHQKHCCQGNSGHLVIETHSAKSLSQTNLYDLSNSFCIHLGPIPCEHSSRRDHRSVHTRLEQVSCFYT